jgi:hypothetical protein
VLTTGPAQCQDDSPPDGVNEEDSSTGECDDWDVLLGQQCDNDFPPGESPKGNPGEDPDPGGETGGEDTGGEDTGGEDTGEPIPDVVIEQLDCEDCEVITTDGGDVIWINEGNDDSGGGSGSASTLAEESALAAHVFDLAVVGSQLVLADDADFPTIVAIHRVVDRKIVRRADGSALVQVDLQTLYSNMPVASRHRFEIGKCSTSVRKLN